MCFGKPKKKSTEDKVVDLLKDAAEHGGVPSGPVEIVTSMVGSQADGLRDLAGALDEVTKGINGEKINMDKIKKAGQVDKTLADGVTDGMKKAGGGLLKGIFKFLTGS